MTSPSDITVAVLADSRGLDTYYLNDRYDEYYGIDRVFATRLNHHLNKRDQKGALSVLIPDHFRNGTVETKIRRLALNNPSHVVLCDGIWETLLNREKYFQEAEVLNALPTGLFASENDSVVNEAGRVLTDLFKDEKLTVSPKQFSGQMNTIVGYFARRRRNVGWLSLVVPPVGHRDGVHYAGNYRPLPGWGDCLEAINQAARQTLAQWNGRYLDLDPIVEAAGGVDNALLDQWHFSSGFQDRVADFLAEEITGEWSLSASISSPEHLSHKVIVRGRDDVDRVVFSGEPDPADPTLATLRETAIVVDAPMDKRDTVAQALLAQTDISNVVLYPEELSDPSGSSPVSP